MMYLQDIRFDLSSPQTIRIDFAKSNSKIKRLSAVDLFPSDKRLSSVIGSLPYPYPPPGYPVQYNTSYPLNPIPPMVPWGFGQTVNTREHTTRPSNRTSKVSPCSTLFVANIHRDVPENDITRLFRSIEGFQRLKRSQKDGSSICFVEYSDVNASTNALQRYQGFMLGPSEIRIQFARSRMGDRGRENQSNEQQENQQKLSSARPLDNATNTAEHSAENHLNRPPPAVVQN